MTYSVTLDNKVDDERNRESLETIGISRLFNWSR